MNYTQYPQTVNLQPDAIQPPDGFAEIYANAREVLQQAGDHLLREEWLDVVSCCKIFLETPGFTDQLTKDEKGVKNYRLIATAFLAANHTLESVLSLKYACNNMLDFCDSVFHAPVKKGIAASPPLIGKEDAVFLYSFCCGYFNLLISKIK